MGNHFDAVIELLNWGIQKGEKTKLIPDVHSYLTDIVERAALFQLYSKSDEVFPKPGENKHFDRYIADYARLSAKHGQHLIMPFELTAIEDLNSVVFLDRKENNEYIVTKCISGKGHRADDFIEIKIGKFIIRGPQENNKLYVQIEPTYKANWVNRGNGMINLEKNLSIKVKNYYSEHSDDKIINRAGGVFIKELVYIMDHTNYIVRVETNQSRNLERKLANKNKKNGKPRKTVMRPYHIVLNEKDMVKFFRGESKEEGHTIHPVIKFPRILRSPYFVNMQNQKIYVKQHLRGTGIIEGKNGIHYHVLLKISPTEIVPYSR